MASKKDISILDPNEWRSLELMSRQRETPTTSRFTFRVPTNSISSSSSSASSCSTSSDGLTSWGIVVSCYVLVGAPIGPNGEMVERCYTPVSRDTETSSITFLIKRYERGIMSRYLHDTLRVGDLLSFKGCFRKLKLAETLHSYTRVGMLAGGTGITPMLQVIGEYMAHAAETTTEIILLAADRSIDEILYRKELEEYKAKLGSHRFQVYHTISGKTGDDWMEGNGRITTDLITEWMPEPGEPNTLILVCGPPQFMHVISGEAVSDEEQGPLSGLLRDMGYNPEQVYKF